MLLHRAETFLHIVSTTEFIEKKVDEKTLSNVMELIWAAGQADDDDGQTTDGDGEVKSLNCTLE